MKTSTIKQQGPEIHEGKPNSATEADKRKEQQDNYPRKTEKDKQYDQQPEFTESRPSTQEKK